MKKESTLSEEIIFFEKGHVVDKYYTYLIPRDEVKKAIKRIKDRFKYKTYWQKVCFEIDEVVGPKLDGSKE